MAKNKYMLISTTTNREIMTEKFETKSEAYAQMIMEMRDWGRISDELLSPNNIGDDNGSFGYYEDGAYVNDGVNGMDYDWLIVEI